ncbi:hypothetical protein B7C62_28190 [Kitasatospora albolonga]|uniref:Uncharacterized protein n=1 Tax=Kitasatospora albolonga TaxID=68173 RepID=A0ABC8BZJ4_9ACTN|nr:hypothetical protein B7C62_28190 [Kitasatospora albolonga]
MTAIVVPLWETDHPYYCTEGNYYARPVDGLHTEYPSWAAFFAEWGGLDPDLNLVFRWDWKRSDPADYEPYDEPVPPDTLAVFWVLQRKAILRSTECVVTEADEPAVRAWLTECAAHMGLLWEPLLPAPAA